MISSFTRYSLGSPRRCFTRGGSYANGGSTCFLTSQNSLMLNLPCPDQVSSLMFNAEFWSNGNRYRKKFDVEITFNNITRTITSFTREDFVLNKSDWISKKDDFKEAVDYTSWRSLNSSCNGLILVYNYHQVKGPMYYIVNPATRQWVTLPQCIYSTHNGGGLGYDPATKKYKVVQLFRHCSKLSYQISYGCAVLTLGSDRWKVVRYPFKNVSELERSIYVNGFLHFKCQGGPQSPGYNTFVSMDIANETFWMISPPRGD